jgi:hypothetical protein
VVVFDQKAGHPADTEYQLAENRIPPQDHY